MSMNTRECKVVAVTAGIGDNAQTYYLGGTLSVPTGEWNERRHDSAPVTRSATISKIFEYSETEVLLIDEDGEYIATLRSPTMLIQYAKGTKAPA